MTQVVLLGYGGPETPAEVRPFLDRIVAGRPIPPERYEQVVRNYEIIGGSSPFNELTRRQAAALEEELRRRGLELPVRVAYRFVTPFISDAARVSREGGEQSVAVILAAQQSEASWDKYVELFPGARFTRPLFNASGFVQAHADRIREALRAASVDDINDLALVFTAHSIPSAMAQSGPYIAQLNEGAQLICDSIGARRYDLAYTSRTGSPREPWLEPDVRDLLRALAERGARDVLVDPLGFVCDHVEVLYDLDVDAAAVASSLGIRLIRAQALNDHPAFIAAIADSVQACLV